MGGFKLSCGVELGDYTTEARRKQSKKFLIRNSPISALCVSAVNPSSQKARNKQIP
jgi:hypothetical protein